MTQTKRESHALAGQTVTLVSSDPSFNGQQYRIEDWWENVYGQSWMTSEGNPACLKYAMRSVFCALPMDNEVVYGKIGGIGHLVHVNELGEPS
jgi:hypothetical protein